VPTASISSDYLTSNFAYEQCPIGYPVVFGAENQDGDSDITVFTAAPTNTTSNRTYIMVVGGHTYSDYAMPEKIDACQSGCGLVATYDKFTNTYVSRYVYENMEKILDLQSSDLRGTTFILFSRRTEDGKHRYGMAWLEFSDTIVDGTATPIQVGYTSKYPYDSENWNGFSKQVLV